VGPGWGGAEFADQRQRPGRRNSLPTLGRGFKGVRRSTPLLNYGRNISPTRIRSTQPTVTSCTLPPGPMRIMVGV
jgi:hypothetical protein